MPFPSIHYLKYKYNINKLEKKCSECKTMDEFIDLMKKEKYEPFLQYYTGDMSLPRSIFSSLYDYLKIDFKGKSFLDLGPGNGISMDIAKEREAASLSYVDYDPVIFTFNMLKGYEGHKFDYCVGNGLTPLYPRKFDIILSKGSLNADRLNRKESPLILFEQWIEQLMNIIAPGGMIIICPTFDRGSETVNGSYYVCKDPEAFKLSYFAKNLLERGFVIDTIKGFNEPQERFPFTFIKMNGRV